jgi:molybdate transport system substrate-binding protein
MSLKHKVLAAVMALCATVTTFAQSTSPSASGKSTAKPANTVPRTGDLTIAAAADLAPALEAIMAAFRKSQNANVKATYGASGTLTAQIEQGAPFDVFMSADLDYPKRLISEKKADAKSLTDYARGRLVVFIMPGVPGDVLHTGLKALVDPKIEKIAIANPDHAPYGRAAVAALKHEGVYDQVKPKLVIAENVGQAAQFVKSGNAQAGIFALSAMNDRELRRHGRVVEVKDDTYPPLEQGAVILSHGERNPLAKVFVDYLKSQMAQGLFVRYGFMPPSTYKDEGGPKAPDKNKEEKPKTPAKKPATPKK